MPYWVSKKYANDIHIDLVYTLYVQSLQNLLHWKVETMLYLAMTLKVLTKFPQKVTIAYKRKVVANELKIFLFP
jgi:hypothetical protein